MVGKSYPSRQMSVCEVKLAWLTYSERPQLTRILKHAPTADSSITFVNSILSTSHGSEIGPSTAPRFSSERETVPETLERPIARAYDDR